MVSRLPEALRSVLWDLDFDHLDVVADADSIIARVLEHGRLTDVRAVLQLYGSERILAFFRGAAHHPIVSERTRQFWRAYFHAEEESWPKRPDWRTSSGAPWID